MTEQFQLSFEQVQLQEPFGPEGPVYLFMRATVYNPSQPDVALWTAATGGLSAADSNLSADGTATPVMPFAPSPGLPAGVVFRNDGVFPERQVPSGPTFSVLDIPVEPSERVRLELVLAPEVWFHQNHIPLDDWDRALLTIYMASAGAAGGVAGALIGVLAGVLNPFGGQDVEVPCFNAILQGEHDWSAGEVRDLARNGPHEYGPTGAAGTLGCPTASAKYWISARQLGFVKEPTCVLLPIEEDQSVPFAPAWGDYGLLPSDQVNAWLAPAASGKGAYDVTVRERQSASKDVLRLTFPGVEVTTEFAIPWYLRNEYDYLPFGYRSVVPASGDCSAFTNVKAGTPWVDLLGRLDRVLEFATEERARAGTAVRAPGDREPVSPESTDRIDVPQNLADGAADEGSEPLGSRDDRDVIRSGGPSPWGRAPFTRFADVRQPRFEFPKVRVFRLTAELVLMQYGEYRRSKFLVRRLRYLRTAGPRLMTDVMLVPTQSPPR